MKPFILKYVSKRLRDDKDVAIAALSKSKKAFEYVGDELKNDEEILKLCE